MNIYENILKLLKIYRIEFNKNSYKNKSWHTLAEINKNGNIDQLLSQKTLEGRQINIKSFINWCELEYKGIIQARYINSGFPKILIKKTNR